MKLSRDNSSLTAQQIQDRVNEYAGLGLTHLTVCCYYQGSFHDDTDRENWVTAVRNLGLKVWWRGTYSLPNWPSTPGELSDLFLAFPARRTDLFQNGDIFDMCPEQSPFFHDGTNYVFGTTVQEMVDAWNPWVRQVKTDLDTIFSNAGKSGVITGITSIVDFNALNYVEPATYAHLGYACIDHYPSNATMDPAKAARNVLSDVVRLHDKAGVPVVVGEYGYARNADATQANQRQALRQIFNELANLPWMAGYNYWCGHGGSGFGEFCNLLELSGGSWVPRAGLKTIGDFYRQGHCRNRLTVL